MLQWNSKIWIKYLHEILDMDGIIDKTLYNLETIKWISCKLISIESKADITIDIGINMKDSFK